jgi:hypothetical protein
MFEKTHPVIQLNSDNKICYSFISPLKMILGISALAAVFGLFYLITNEQPAAAQFKNEHPILRILLIVLVCSIVIYMLDAVALTLYGFLVPNAGKTE